MTKTRMDTGLPENRAAPDSAKPKRPILNKESGELIERITEVIGDESVSSFARRSGVSEGVIRSYINDGRMPSIDKAAAIADAGSVTVDWLATGRLPKTRAEWREKNRPPSSDLEAFDGRRDMLEAVLRMAEYKIRNNQVNSRIIEMGLSGAAPWMDAARDYPDLESRLRTMIATLEFMKAAGVE